MPPDFQLSMFRFGVAVVPICIGLVFTKQLPKVLLSESRMFVLGAMSYILFNILVYSHYIKFLPLGSVGAILNGSSVIFCIVLTLLFDR